MHRKLKLRKQEQRMCQFGQTDRVIPWKILSHLHFCLSLMLLLRYSFRATMLVAVTRLCSQKKNYVQRHPCCCQTTWNFTILSTVLTPNLRSEFPHWIKENSKKYKKEKATSCLDDWYVCLYFWIYFDELSYCSMCVLLFLSHT